MAESVAVGHGVGLLDEGLLGTGVWNALHRDATLTLSSETYRLFHKRLRAGLRERLAQRVLDALVKLLLLQESHCLRGELRAKGLLHFGPHFVEGLFQLRFRADAGRSSQALDLCQLREALIQEVETLARDGKGIADLARLVRTHADVEVVDAGDFGLGLRT